MQLLRLSAAADWPLRSDENLEQVGLSGKKPIPTRSSCQLPKQIHRCKHCHLICSLLPAHRFCIGRTRCPTLTRSCFSMSRQVRALKRSIFVPMLPFTRPSCCCLACVRCFRHECRRHAPWPHRNDGAMRDRCLALIRRLLYTSARHIASCSCSCGPMLFRRRRKISALSVLVRPAAPAGCLAAF